MLKHTGWLVFALATTVQAQTKTDPNEVVISRGGVAITLQDIDTYVARVPKEQRERFIDSPTRIRDLLNNMLLTKELAVQGRAEHLEKHADVANQLRAAEDEVLARARMAEFLASIKVPDLTELAREQYQSHKDVYKLPPVVDVKQLLVSIDKHPDAEAKALAEKARAEALADPGGFDAIVEKYSEDNSKANHGLIKDAASNNWVPEFRQAAGSLTKPGEISPLVHTSYGYHVLQLVSREPDRQQTFEDVREQVIASMRDQFIANERRDFVNQLNNQKVDINPANLDTLRDRYDENGNVKVAGAAAQTSPGPAPAPPAQKH